MGISIPGETPAQAAIRECVEETGLAVAHPASGPMLIHVDVHQAAEDHVHLDLRYLVWAPDEEPVARPGREPGRGMVHLGGRRCHRRRRAGRGPRVGPSDDSRIPEAGRSGDEARVRGDRWPNRSTP